MSNAVTALQGASANGAITIEDAGLTGMITLRADLADDAVRGAVRSAGLQLPGKGEATGGQGTGALWMSPDELLILGAYDTAEAQIASLTEHLGDLHMLLANVSDARAVFRLTGKGATIRDVLAKLTPADLHPRALPPGRVRRTRLAQVSAAFWFTAEDEAMLICFRSVAPYVFDLLSGAAAEGSEVGYFR